MESMSSTTVDNISSGIGRVDISNDVDVSTRDDVSGHEEDMNSEKKCTSCEQKLDHKTDRIGADASRSSADMVSKEADSDVSTEKISVTDVEICANCGKEGANNSCNKCKMVKYCNAACKKKHRTKHKKACERRVAELRDIELFKQPPPSEEDCPICFVRLPTMGTGLRYKSCCGKVICSGCIHAPVYDNQGNARKDKICAFCRVPSSVTDEEIKRLQKRVDAGDVEAIRNLGSYYFDGMLGLPQDYVKALELYHRAAELGYDEAYNSIGNAYMYGEGVKKDEKKARHYFELAAMRGSPNARHNLGIFEDKRGNMERALKHHMIAVTFGHHNSLKQIQKLYSKGHTTKDDYTKALRVYQEYLNEVKSSQRDKAAAAREDYKYIQ